MKQLRPIATPNPSTVFQQGRCMSCTGLIYKRGLDKWSHGSTTGSPFCGVPLNVTVVPNVREAS